MDQHLSLDWVGDYCVWFEPVGSIDKFWYVLQKFTWIGIVDGINVINSVKYETMEVNLLNNNNSLSRFVSYLIEWLPAVQL